MDDWFEEIVDQIIWKAIKDAYDAVSEAALDAAQDALDDLTPKKLSSSPLVEVLAVTLPTGPDDHGTATIVIRGRQPFFKGALAPFVRIQVVMSRTIAADLDPPIRILEWQTAIGDLRIDNKGVFLAELGFGWDRDHWLGRGILKIGPPKVGVDIKLGGLNDRGLMLGIDVRLPAPIPLGPTGMGLSGVGGDFAYNFKPDLGLGGTDPVSPTAEDYVRWARDHELDNWESAPIQETAVGVGLRAAFGDVASNGFIFKLDPIGLLVLVPGPVFVLGGTGELLSTKAIKAEGYLVVDIPSGSLALGLGVTVKYPPPPFQPLLLDASGTLDALFSFNKPSIWYIHLGTKAAPIKAKVIKIFEGTAYFVVDSGQIMFGVGIAVGDEWEFWIIKFVAKAGAKVDVRLGWDPVQLEGRFELWGELGLSVWEFDFKITLKAAATGRVPSPTNIEFQVAYELDLPWPIPNIDGTAKVTLGDDPTPPSLATPLRSSEAVDAGDRSRLASLHPITGRQWDLAKTVAAGAEGAQAAQSQGFPWPDAEIVIPFNQATKDLTNVVRNPHPGTRNQGGYDVTHQIAKIELRNLIDDTLVSPLTGVWAAGPDGKSGRLHLLGTNPFDWLSPHTDTYHWAYPIEGETVEQRFGYGASEVLAAGATRRFGDVEIKVATDSALLTDYAPLVPTRVLQTSEASFSFSTSTGFALTVDRVQLLILVGSRDSHPGSSLQQSAIGVASSAGPVTLVADLGSVYGDLRLVAVDVLSAPGQEVQISSTWKDAPFLVVGVRYHVGDHVLPGSFTRTLLVPARYRLTIEGNSAGTHSAGAPAPAPVAWSQTQEFEVRNPESLRPYIRMTTLGDPRVFGRVEEWNPTPVGLGFPAYQHYHPVVRFLVPYMDDIFDHVRTRIRYHTGTEVREDPVPTPAADGMSSLPPESQVWLTAHGGVAPADEELVVVASLPEPGPVAVSLSYRLPDGTEIPLDEWPATASKFARFADHLAWSGTSIVTFHSSTGTTTVSACPLPPDLPPGPGRVGIKGQLALERALADVGDLRDVRLYRPRSPFAVDISDLLGDLVPMPNELTAPPVDWVLPQPLVNQVTDPGSQPRRLDAETPVRFARFAAASGVRFGPSAAEPMDTLGAVAASTSIEALVDDVGRPYALWLRTPEPVDWRRVTTSLHIRHVVQAGNCPSSFARRQELVVSVAVLPSADASSAFLVGEMGGVWTRLPRGVYELTLRFDPVHAELPTLRPDPAVGPTPESVTYRFVQPSGLDWPLPSDSIVIPHRFFELLRDYLDVDPGPIHELIKQAYGVDIHAQLDAIDVLRRQAESEPRLSEGRERIDASPEGKGEESE